MTRPPSEIRPEADGSNPFSFPRLVQPVLESRCVPCHERSGSPWAPDLGRGDWKKDEFRWYASYRSLMPYAFHHGSPFHGLNDYDGWSTSRGTPGGIGARASRLLALLAEGHHGLELPPGELRRLTLWLDCNADFFGAYEETDAQAAGEVVKPRLE